MPHQTSPLSSPASTALPISSVCQHTAGRLPTLLLPVRAMLLAALLTACGGGGGAGGDKKVPTPDSYVSILSQQPPDPGYTGSEKAVYDLFNSERARCGFGYLTRNTKIDQAALAHTRWQLLNLNREIAHTEISGTAGFTGVKVWDRVVVAGYDYRIVGEVIGANYDYAGVAGGDAFGRDASIEAARGLLAAPYHALGILGQSGVAEMGIGFQYDSKLDVVNVGSTPLNRYFGVLTVNFGLPSGAQEQSLGADVVATYPCDGTRGVDYQMNGETPNPVPSRNLLVNPIGHPIYVMVAQGHTLSIDNASVRSAGGTNVTLLPTLIATTDTNAKLTSEPHVAAIMPSAPLQPNTSYSVLITGKNNGTPFTRQFSFTTGAGG